MCCVLTYQSLFKVSNVRYYLVPLTVLPLTDHCTFETETLWSNRHNTFINQKKLQTKSPLHGIVIFREMVPTTNGMMLKRFSIVFLRAQRSLCLSLILPFGNVSKAKHPLDQHVVQMDLQLRNWKTYHYGSSWYYSASSEPSKTLAVGLINGVMALTVLLPKSDNPSNAMDLRPITILSRVYRQWSRYRALTLISGLSKLVPNTVAGGTSNMSSLLLSGHFQDLLEDSDNLKTLCGLTIDIVKCYNTLPRYPLALYMRKLGWPYHIIKTYMSALYQMRRSFMVLNSASDWQSATTGIPEGCD